MGVILLLHLVDRIGLAAMRTVLGIRLARESSVAELPVAGPGCDSSGIRAD